VQRPLTNGPKGWPVGVIAFESVQTKTSWRRVYMRRERLWWWRKLVEAELIGRPAATSRVTASAKLVELSIAL
jgi:hypothetical protein